MKRKIFYLIFLIVIISIIIYAVIALKNNNDKNNQEKQKKEIVISELKSLQAEVNNRIEKMDNDSIFWSILNDSIPIGTLDKSLCKDWDKIISNEELLSECGIKRLDETFTALEKYRKHIESNVNSDSLKYYLEEYYSTLKYLAKIPPIEISHITERRKKSALATYSEYYVESNKEVLEEAVGKENVENVIKQTILENK